MHITKLFYLFVFLFTSCQHQQPPFETSIVYFPQPRQIQRLPTQFPPLTPNEFKELWAKELAIGQGFAAEFDFYRAITAFKRALFLLPPELYERRLQIEYSIVLSYYLGGRYQDSIESFEGSSLTTVPDHFPAIQELLLLLEDSYRKLNRCTQADNILEILQNFSPEKGDTLQIGHAVETADFCALEASPLPTMQCFLDSYYTEAKSVTKARTLNTFLPGAGYWYIDQKKSAVTAFCINTLFTFAAYQFFQRGYPAAGIITTSLELGWYLGGINGAGLEAQAYNERLYSCLAKEYMLQERLFPILLFETAF